jgi:hypothetical protein
MADSHSRYPLGCGAGRVHALIKAAAGTARHNPNHAVQRRWIPCHRPSMACTGSGQSFKGAGSRDFGHPCPARDAGNPSKALDPVSFGHPWPACDAGNHSTHRMERVSSSTHGRHGMSSHHSKALDPVSSAIHGRHGMSSHHSKALDPVSSAIHGRHGMRASCPHLTPCMSFWIKGAIRNSTTPAPTSA